jgi:hypothetical protein
MPKSYEDLDNTIQTKFKNKIPDDYELLYKDADDEMISLSNEDDFRTAVASADMKGLRIFVEKSRSQGDQITPQLLKVPELKGANSVPNVEMVLSQTLNDENKSLTESVNHDDSKVPLYRTPSDPVNNQAKLGDQNSKNDGPNFDKLIENLPPIPVKVDRDSSLSSVDKFFNFIPKIEEKDFNIVGDVKDIKETTKDKAKKDKNDEIFGFIPKIEEKHIHLPAMTTSAQKKYEPPTTDPGKDTEKCLFNPEQIRFMKQLINEAITDRLSAFGMANNLHSPVPIRTEEKKIDPVAYFKTSEVSRGLTHDYACNNCSLTPIIGVRYKCTVCPNFDFCEACEKTCDHAHPFIKIKDLQHQKVLESKADNPMFYSSINCSGMKAMKDPIPMRMSMSFLKEDSNKKYYKAKLSKEPPNPISIEAGKSYTISFTLKNNGNSVWPSNAKIICIEGIHKGVEEKIPQLEQEKEADINLQLQAPTNDGKYASSWKLSYIDPDDNGIKYFGPKITFEIKVETKKAGYHLNQHQSNLFGSQHHNNKDNLELKYTPDVLEKANLLYDMFGGDLKDHIDFVRGCKKDITIEEVVEIFLARVQSSRRSSVSKSGPMLSTKIPTK